jgi:hypothetical protein
VIGVRCLFVTGTVGQNVALLFEAVSFNLSGIFGLGTLSSGRFDLSFDHGDGLRERVAAISP